MTCLLSPVTGQRLGHYFTDVRRTVLLAIDLRRVMSSNTIATISLASSRLYYQPQPPAVPACECDALGRQRRAGRQPAAADTGRHGASIGHLKAGHRMRWNFLKGALVDAMNPILAAAGFNTRWLTRWLVTFWRWILFAVLPLLDHGGTGARSDTAPAGA